MHKIDGADFQCVNNPCPKFEYKGMNTVGVTDNTMAFRRRADDGTLLVVFRSFLHPIK